jgi:hypothetical protein
VSSKIYAVLKNTNQLEAKAILKLRLITNQQQAA